jgi:hypothetical protein
MVIDSHSKAELFQPHFRNSCFKSKQKRAGVSEKRKSISCRTGKDNSLFIQNEQEIT